MTIFRNILDQFFANKSSPNDSTTIKTVLNESLCYLSSILTKEMFLEFLDVKGMYFDYFSASKKFQNDHSFMKMVSNESMRYISKVFIKNII